MNWQAIKRFNFTYALTGGAWLEDDKGYRNWETFAYIEHYMGAGWFDRQLKKQGMFTGCWVDVD